MNILCRLGWHRWKPIYRQTDFSKPLGVLYAECGRSVGEWLMGADRLYQRYYQLGHKCTRCGRRKQA